MPERTLTLKLLALVSIKLMVLAGLWVLFVRDSVIPVDTASISDHFLTTPSPSR